VQDATRYAPRGLAQQQAHFGAEWCPANRDLWAAAAAFNAAAPTSGEPVFVYANEGRWIVECPDCRGAQLACLTDPRFMCHCCANIGNSGHWRPVVWPKNKARLEKILHARDIVNQNWYPGESIRQLVAENLEHGLAA
jgi:hypothetical protein